MTAVRTLGTAFDNETIVRNPQGKWSATDGSGTTPTGGALPTFAANIETDQEALQFGYVYKIVAPCTVLLEAPSFDGDVPPQVGFVWPNGPQALTLQVDNEARILPLDGSGSETSSIALGDSFAGGLIFRALDDGEGSYILAFENYIGSAGGSGGLTRDPVVKVEDFTAAVNTSYQIDSLAEENIEITLPAAPADMDQVELIGINTGANYFVVNGNGIDIAYPHTVVGPSIPFSFQGAGFVLLLEFRSDASGGHDRWQAIKWSGVIPFGLDTAPASNSVLKTNDSGQLEAIHESHWVRTMGVTATVEGGGAPYAANPWEIVPVDLTTGDAVVNLPDLPLGGKIEIWVKIKGPASGNTCTVNAYAGQTIDWGGTSMELTTNHEWAKLIFNDVDGTWLQMG